MGKIGSVGGSWMDVGGVSRRAFFEGCLVGGFLSEAEIGSVVDCCRGGGGWFVGRCLGVGFRSGVGSCSKEGCCFGGPGFGGGGRLTPGFCFNVGSFGGSCFGVSSWATGTLGSSGAGS